MSTTSKKGNLSIRITEQEGLIGEKVIIDVNLDEFLHMVNHIKLCVENGQRVIGNITIYK